MFAIVWYTSVSTISVSRKPTSLYRTETNEWFFPDERKDMYESTWRGGTEIACEFDRIMMTFSVGRSICSRRR